MVSKTYQAEIPGSIMLCGEHAVLRGSLAIASAVDKHITVTLTPRADKTIKINSYLLGDHELQISDIAIKEPFQFVLTAIASYSNKLSCGFDLEIASEFSDQLGLGSSAAVTVATISVIEQWLHKQPEQMQLFKLAKKVVQKAQGIGSGTDIVASVFGGTVAYKMKPLYIEKLAHNPPLIIVYSGSKTPTVEVIKVVTALEKKYPKTFKNIFAAINSCAEKAITAINNKDWPKLGELMNIHQGLQDAMGTNNETLSRLIFELRQQPDICGAKISGAGLGDCVIGIAVR